MCLGFLYHTIRFPEIFTGIRNLGPEYLILDTAVMPGKGRLMKPISEDVELERNALEGPFSHRGRVLTARPTTEALEFMLTTFGYEVVKRFDWQRVLSSRRVPGVKSYRDGRRVTWVIRVV